MNCQFSALDVVACSNFFLGLLDLGYSIILIYFVVNILNFAHSRSNWFIFITGNDHDAYKHKC